MPRVNGLPGRAARPAAVQLRRALSNGPILGALPILAGAAEEGLRTTV
jgi:hypothetical protein